MPLSNFACPSDFFHGFHDPQYFTRGDIDTFGTLAQEIGRVLYWLRKPHDSDGGGGIMVPAQGTRRGGLRRIGKTLHGLIDDRDRRLHQRVDKTPHRTGRGAEAERQCFGIPSQEAAA